MFGFFFSHALTFILDIFLVIYGLSCFEGKISFSAVHTTLSFERIVPAEERLCVYIMTAICLFGLVLWLQISSSWRLVESGGRMKRNS